MPLPPLNVMAKYQMLFGNVLEKHALYRRGQAPSWRLESQECSTCHYYREGEWLPLCQNCGLKFSEPISENVSDCVVCDV